MSATWTGNLSNPLIIILLAWSITACHAPSHKDPTPENADTLVFNCPECPTLETGSDTLEFVRNVRRFVASVSDIGLINNPVCDRSEPFDVDHFPISLYLHIFEQDSGHGANWLITKIMAKILIENGVDAYTYSFGLAEKNLTHEVVLFKYRNRLCISDPFINYDLLRMDGSPMDLLTLIEMVGKDSLKFRTTTDSVKYDMLIDERLLTGPMRERMKDPACAGLLSDPIPVRDSVFKLRLDRCFACDLNSCFSLIKRIEDGLKEETSLTRFHEAYVIKTRPLWGARDNQEMDDLIETTIYSQPNLGKRVRKRL